MAQKAVKIEDKVKTANFKPLLSQRGMSIPEVLTAVVIISIMSLSVAYFSSLKEKASQSQSVDAFNCQVQVNSILNELRAEGQGATVYNWYPHQSNDYSYTAARVWDSAGGAQYQSTIVDPAFRNQTYIGVNWPNRNPTTDRDQIRTNFEVARLNLAPLQRSTVNLVEYLYNEHRTDLCVPALGGSTDRLDTITQKYSRALTRPAGFIAGTDTDSGPTQEVETTYRISPYNVKTGELIASCPTDLSTIPIGQRDGDTNESGFDATQGHLGAATVALDDNRHIGYKVEVFTTVRPVGSTNIVTQCNGTQLIEHQRDWRSPMPTAGSLGVAIVRNSTLGNLASNSATMAARQSGNNSQTNQVEIAFRIEGYKPGSFLLCRDRSKIPGRPATQSSRYAACMGAPLNGALNGNSGLGPGPQRARGATSTDIRSVYTATSTTEAVSAIGYIEDVLEMSAPNWVPCDRVSVCRINPVASTFTLNSSRNAASITGITGTTVEFINEYQNLRAECIINLEVKATDAAGNILASNLAAPTVVRNRKAQTTSLSIHDAGGGSPSSQNILTSGAVVAAENSADNLGEVARQACGNYCENNAGTTPFPAGSLTAYFNAPGVGVGNSGTYGAGGYWQVSACCQSPTVSGQILAYMGVMNTTGGSGLTAEAQAFKTEWMEAFACRPGWSRAGATYVDRLSTNTAVLGQLMRHGYSQDVSSNAGGSTSPAQAPRPYHATVDNWTEPMAENIRTVSSTATLDAGTVVAGTTCGHIHLTQSEYNQLDRTCRRYHGGGDSGGYWEYNQQCPPGHTEARLNAASAAIGGCNIDAILPGWRDQLPARLRQRIEASRNYNGATGFVVH